MKYCKKCVTPDTRARVVFDETGVCNACNWAEKKKGIDWRKRQDILNELLGAVRRKKGWDVLVPCSGGKDGSYVAWKMKHQYNMNPLCVTFSPPMQTEIGRRNLENFRNSGFDLIEIRPNPDVYKKLCRRMFIEQARTKFPFVIGIGTAIAQIALKMGITLVIYGEEGETEYGGEDNHVNEYFMSYDYAVDIYHEGHDMRQYLDEFNEREIAWWIMPARKAMKALLITWWSKYEPWDDQLHRDLAIDECGLTTTDGEVGTFTNYAQLDDILQDLHQYEMFIKYGHGRATADCNLAVHGGRITRGEAVEIIKEKDGIFPLKYLPDYLEYFNMEEKTFWNIIDFHANKDILEKTDNPERPWILKVKPT